MGQSQNLAKDQDGPGQSVKIRYETQDRTVQDFDSCPIPSHRAKQDGAEKDVLKQEKGGSKIEKVILKQERMF